MNVSLLFSDLSVMTFSASVSQPSGFTTNNLYNYNPGSKCSLETTTDGIYYLNVDLGSSQTCDTLVLENTNFDSCLQSGDIYLQSANDSGFTSGVTTEVVGLIATNTLSKYDVAFTKRYLRLVFSGSFSEYPYVGNIFIGQKLTFTHAYDWGYKIDDPEFTTNTYTNLLGTTRGSQVNTTDRAKYSVKFSFQDEDARTSVASFVQDVRGKLLPFYFISDSDIYYVKFSADYKPIEVMNWGLHNIQAFDMNGYTITTPTAVSAFMICEEELITSIT